MGIYVFNREVLIECLENDLEDFGKHIIPESIKDRHVSALHFQGLLGRHRNDSRLLRGEPRSDRHRAAEYSFFEPRSADLHASAFSAGQQNQRRHLRQAIISDGCIISDAHIERSVIGVRSIIQSGATIRNSIVMGADYLNLSQ